VENLLSDYSKKLSVIILAAGKGKRMKSEIPKVLHNICYQPILYYILSSVTKINPKNIFVIVGHKKELVEEYLKNNFPGVTAVSQENQLGTAHAVIAAKGYLKEFGSETLILPGDIPMITADTLSGILAEKTAANSDGMIITALLENPTGYGRIIKKKNGNILKIVEETDTTPEERKINEINTSIYCFNTKILFENLKKISSENSQNEFYLTDIIENLVRNNLKVTNFSIADSLEVEGINDRIQLTKIEKLMQQKINFNLMASGVTIRNPQSCLIGANVQIEKDTTIEPYCFIKGETFIGNNCVIGPFTQIEDCRISSGTRINASVVIGSEIGSHNNIGPYSYVRPGTVTSESVKIGAFCEIKKSKISSRSKVPHLSYIGDTEIGKDVNVGASTVTCNYDGFTKNKTIIEDGVFIGSDTMLVAPVKIGRGAITAAGSVITQDVPPDNLTVARQKQINIKKGAAKFREKKEKNNKEKEGD
jgi:bifunctional UDP-N-acetylglucosamine pyrophosphorylase / glucosamine-1-phosphate N-acetyltransferase